MELKNNLQKNLNSAEIQSGNKFKFDIWYAEAWSRRQGYFSFKIANNLKKKLADSGVKINSVLDVCSGSGEFLNVCNTFIKDCVGIDNAEGYLDYVKTKYPNIAFKKVDKLYTFELGRKFDLITCNHDVINMFLKFEEWVEFFKVCFNHLNEGGRLLFDFYSEKTMNTWEKVIFEQDYTLDYVQKVSNENGVCIMDEVYYIRENESLYRKTADKMIETGFPTEAVKKALEEVGFSKIDFIDINFEKRSETDDVERVHILCQK